MGEICLGEQGSRGQGDGGGGGGGEEEKEEFVVDKYSSLVAQRERRAHFRFSVRVSQI
jgi:hypothetical protein